MTRAGPIQRLQACTPVAAALLASAMFAGSFTLAEDAPATSQPASQPTTQTAQQKRRDEAYFKVQRANRDNQRKAHESLPEAPPVERLDALVMLAEENGRLSAKIVPPVDAKPQARFRVKGVDGTFEVRAAGSFINRGGGRRPVGLPRVTRYEFEPATDDALWVAHLDAGDGYFSINAQSLTGRTSLVQNDDHVTFSLFRRDPGGVFRQAFHADADSFRDLRAAHPREFEELVVPILSKFSDLPFLRPGPAEVYRAFADLPADPTVTERVVTLIPALAADAFPERDAASRQLADLGQPGVLAIMRLDAAQLAELTDEQRSRLAAVVAASRRFAPSFEPEAALQDPRFLADCLEDTDPAVRAAAKRQLEKVLGHAVEFDPASEGDIRSSAAANIRKTLPKRREPTTQPAPAAPS
jgi:hypothetical protein